MTPEQLLQDETQPVILERLADALNQSHLEQGKELTGEDVPDYLRAMTLHWAYRLATLNVDVVPSEVQKTILAETLLAEINAVEAVIHNLLWNVSISDMLTHVKNRDVEGLAG